jgi:hypothetical protein
MAVEVRFHVRERDLGSALDAVMGLPVVGEVLADHVESDVRESRAGGGWTGLATGAREEARDGR